jgi:hypothetical protein
MPQLPPKQLVAFHYETIDTFVIDHCLKLVENQWERSNSLSRLLESGTHFVQMHVVDKICDLITDRTMRLHLFVEALNTGDCEVCLEVIKNMHYLMECDEGCKLVLNKALDQNLDTVAAAVVSNLRKLIANESMRAQLLNKALEKGGPATALAAVQVLPELQFLEPAHSNFIIKALMNGGSEVALAVLNHLEQLIPLATDWIWFVKETLERADITAASAVLDRINQLFPADAFNLPTLSPVLKELYKDALLKIVNGVQEYNSPQAADLVLKVLDSAIQRCANRCTCDIVRNIEIKLLLNESFYDSMMKKIAQSKLDIACRVYIKNVLNTQCGDRMRSFSLPLMSCCWSRR